PAARGARDIDTRPEHPLSSAHPSPGLPCARPMNRYHLFDRIRDRLVAAFTVLMAGTLVTWWFGSASLNRTTRDVTASLEQLQESAELGTRLESMILEQLAMGERYLVSGGSTVAANFR